MGDRMTRLIVEIPPQPKQRPRFVNGRVYTQKQTVEHENTIALEYVLKRLKKHLGPVSVFITFNYRIPTSRIKQLKHGDTCSEKADIDNLVKAVLDGLNGVAYLDDKQVYKIVAEKKWANSNSIDIMIFDKEEE